MDKYNSKTNVKTVGEGKPILVLHGWGSSIKAWEKVQNDLAARGYKVIIPDMPGFGGTDTPHVPWNSNDYLNWLLDFTKNYSPRFGEAGGEAGKLQTPISIIGHSFGGGLAMKLAISHPEMIDKLVLVGAARIKHKRPLRKIIISKIAKAGRLLSFLPFYETFRKIFYKFIVREKDYVRTKGVMRETIKLILAENLTPEIDKIKSPTLIIWGDKDKSTPIEDAHIINSKISNSKLTILNGYGHALNLECPEKLAEEISNFIK